MVSIAKGGYSGRSPPGYSFASRPLAGAAAERRSRRLSPAEPAEGRRSPCICKASFVVRRSRGREGASHCPGEAALVKLALRILGRCKDSDMKLFKILKMQGNKGVSVFPTEDQQLPHPEELAGDPWGQGFRILRGLGYTDHQAGRALTAWAYHAKVELHQNAAGVRRFVEQCLIETQKHAMPAPAYFWLTVWSVAVAVAVVLGLYVWVVLDKELNYRFSSHPWAYLMLYEEQLWPAEILNVGYKQEGLYEIGASFGDVLAKQSRDDGFHPRHDWLWLKPGRVFLTGRRLVFYHEYQFTGFFGFFCGVMTNFGGGLYKIREGGNDPYKPSGPWTRPGSRRYQPGYAGCWGDWWWL